MNAHQLGADGVIINTIVVESLDFMPNLISGETGGIGWLWDGETLTPPPVTKKTADKLQEQVREQRNSLLTASDWTQVVDSTVDKAAWATYRQSLRDIPTQNGFPFTVKWPAKPE